MAKRFIHDELLRNPWLRVAPTLQKLLWVALVTECDHAGIWVVDWQMMELLVGGPLDPAAARKFLGKRIIEIDNGDRWFLPDFIRFQYPHGIHTNNNCLKSVRQLLVKHGIDLETLTLKEGLTNPSPTIDQGLQEKEKEIENRKSTSVPHARPPVPKILETDHRGQKVDLYEKELGDATACTGKVLEKLKRDIGDDRYMARLGAYKSLVLFMIDGDPAECPKGMSDTVLMLKDQLSFFQYSKLADLAKNPLPIRRVILNMHNSYAKSVKGKTSLYNTSLDWLKRDLAGGHGSNQNDQSKKALSTPIDVDQ